MLSVQQRNKLAWRPADIEERLSELNHIKEGRGQFVILRHKAEAAYSPAMACQLRVEYSDTHLPSASVVNFGATSVIKCVREKQECIENCSRAPSLTVIKSILPRIVTLMALEQQDLHDHK